MSNLDPRILQDRVTKAWELVTVFGMNEQVALGSAQVPRFVLIDAEGNRQSVPEKAVGLFDFATGKAFLSQVDSDWVSQLLERFRLSVQWDAGLSEWRATTPAQGKYGNPITATGPTPGVAIVEVLVHAARLGNPPVKHPFKAVA